VESSYEESDADGNTSGVGAPTSAVSRSPSSAAGVKDYQLQVQEAVDREVNNWMLQDAASTESVSEMLSPSRSQDADKTKFNNRTPPRPFVSARAEQDKVHRLATSPPIVQRQGEKPSPLNQLVHSIQDVYGREEDFGAIGGEAEGGTHGWEETMSEISTSYSKTSSAYFNTREVQAIRRGRIEQVSGVRQNRQAAAAVMRRYQPTSSSSPGRTHEAQVDQMPQTSSLTEESLAMKDQLYPPHRTFNASNAVGFRGLLDKTQDVPNLMDDMESDSTSAASAATSRHSSAISGAQQYDSYRNKAVGRYSSSSARNQQQQERVIMEEPPEVSPDRGDTESDVFDGISIAGARRATEQQRRNRKPIDPDGEVAEESDGPGILGAASRSGMDEINLALLGGGLTTIQTTPEDFSHRKTASDFDENLTNSDYDQYGFAKIPAFHEMAVAGMSQHDRSLSTQSLLFAEPSEGAKRFLEKHRQRDNNTSGSDSGSSLFSDHYPEEEWGHNIAGDLSQYYVHPEEMKILVKKFRKMSRDRYPHLDYEDLEREEDATKAFALSEMRSRIMEKDIERGLERKGGTVVVDDIVMTPFNRAALRVRDCLIVAKAWRDGATPQDVINASLLTRRPECSFYIPRLVVSSRGASKYTWEEVKWVDDMELTQYRCHSIGPRHLKGAEMFTIGDCQSILLKLCNDRCLELRAELNDATARQIEAEEAMKEEGETFAFDGMMTEAEMAYLSSMEEVKTVSHKLVLAEKAFTLVKDRIEKLVAKYEALLVRFENETDSVAPSSLFTCESSYYSDDYSLAAEREHETLARRAERAELRAELAAREAMLAKQQAQQVRAEKEKELSNLKARLADLQSESSAAITEREHSVVLARAITANSRNGMSNKNRATSSGGNQISRSKIDDVKQRFRDRNAAKINGDSKVGMPAQSANRVADSRKNANSFYRTVGEEMFQHLDFYERSLKAVEQPRNSSQ